MVSYFSVKFQIEDAAYPFEINKFIQQQKQKKKLIRQAIGTRSYSWNRGILAKHLLLNAAFFS
jgi:hypothetical protein